MTFVPRADDDVTGTANENNPFPNSPRAYPLMMFPGTAVITAVVQFTATVKTDTALTFTPT